MALLQRKHNPPLRKTTSFYKPFLREDFDHRCAYCKNHEAVEGGSKNFEIDHYKPKSKFRNLEHIYSNLFYSCKECNRSKGSYYPTFIEKLMGKTFLNPCDHDFEDHYDMDSPEWMGKTSTAFWNIERLNLNSTLRVKIREEEIFALSKIDELSLREEQLKKILSDNNLLEPLRSEAQQDLQQNQNETLFYKRKTMEIID